MTERKTGLFKRSSILPGCPMAEATLPKLLQQKRLKPFPKHLPGQSVPLLNYPNSQKAFAGVSPLQVAGINRLELRAQSFEYKIEQNLKHWHIIQFMQQTRKGSGKDGAFIVFTERTLRRLKWVLTSKIRAVFHIITFIIWCCWPELC